MKITKQHIDHYYRCIKSNTNDPYDWIHKSILSEKDLDFMDKIFDEFILIKQNKDLKEEIGLKKIKHNFESEKIFQYSVNKFEKLYNHLYILKKTIFERFLLSLNSINIYIIGIVLLIILLIII